MQTPLGNQWRDSRSGFPNRTIRKSGWKERKGRTLQELRSLRSADAHSSLIRKDSVPEPAYVAKFTHVEAHTHL